MSLHDSTTRLMHLESGRYPVYMSEFKMLTPGHAWGEYVDSSLIEAHGYVVVYNSPRPDADVVTEGHPIHMYGAWLQNWHSREFTPEEREAERQQQLDAEKQMRLSQIKEEAKIRRRAGLPCVFPNGSAEHIQIRELDISRLIALAITAKSRPDTPVFFRTQENRLHELTSKQAVLVCEAAIDADRMILATTWYLQEEVYKCTRIEQLLSYQDVVEHFSLVK